jgi:hypothetical protein
MITLNYFSLGSNDPQLFKLKQLIKPKHLIDKIDGLTFGKNRQCVFLYSCSDFVFVHDSIYLIQEIIGSLPLCASSKEHHLHEYESYEDAYAVALGIKEENELCYSKE